MAAIGPLPEDWISADPGAERQQSVGNALAALDGWEDEAFILVHDAARPGVSTDVIDRLLAALQTADAAIPTLPVPDTLVEQAHDEAGDVVDRSVLRSKEHTSELQSLMPTSYAVFRLIKKKITT